MKHLVNMDKKNFLSPFPLLPTNKAAKQVCKQITAATSPLCLATYSGQFGDQQQQTWALPVPPSVKAKDNPSHVETTRACWKQIRSCSHPLLWYQLQCGSTLDQENTRYSDFFCYFDICMNMVFYVIMYL